RGAAGLAAVLDSPHLGNVTELTLNGAAAEGCADALASSAIAGRLRALDWNAGPLRGVLPPGAWAEAERLIRTAEFPSLLRLFFGSVSYGGAFRGEVLAASRCFPALRHLMLSTVVDPGV